MLVNLVNGIIKRGTVLINWTISIIFDIDLCFKVCTCICELALNNLSFLPKKNVEAKKIFETDKIVFLTLVETSLQYEY